MADPHYYIQLALRNAAKEAAAVLSLPLILPEEISIPKDSDYIDCSVTMAQPRRMFLASNKQHWRIGSLIMTCAFRLGQKADVYLMEAQQIAEYFREGRCLQHGGLRVEVVNAPSIQEGYRDEGFWRIPVVIQWRAFA